MDPSQWQAPQFQVAVSGIGLAILIVQIQLNNRNNKASHVRQQEQSTIEAFAKCQTEHHEGNKALRDEYGSTNLTHQQARYLRGHDQPQPPAGTTDVAAWRASEKRRLDALKDYLREYLNSLERLAIGVQHGIYSLDVLEHQAGSLVRRAWERYQEYVKIIRTQADPESGHQSAKAYVGIEWLVNELDKREAKPKAPRTKLGQ